MTTEQPEAHDPNEKRTIVVTNAQIGNLMQCVDLMRRNCEMAQVPAVMELASVLSAAIPVEDGP